MKELRIKRGRPLLNHVILTANRYTEEDLQKMYKGIIPTGMIGQLKSYQTVISISPRITTPIEVGDLVLINIDRYGRSVQKKNSYVESMDEHYDKQIVYELPIIEYDGEECLKLGDNDIEFIIDEYEFVEPEKESLIIKPQTNIIKPK